MSGAEEDAAKAWLRANQPNEPPLPDEDRTGADGLVLIADSSDEDKESGERSRNVLDDVDDRGRLPAGVLEEVAGRGPRELGRLELQESVPLRRGRPHAVDVTLTRQQYHARDRSKPVPPPPGPRKAFGLVVNGTVPTEGPLVRSGRGAVPADGDRCGRCGQTYGMHLVGSANGDDKACGAFEPEWLEDEAAGVAIKAPPLRRGPSAAQRAALVERARLDAAKRAERLRQQYAPDPPEGRRWCANAETGCRELARQGETRCAGCARKAQREARRQK